VSALKYKSREKRQVWTKQHEEDWNFNRGELPLEVSVGCTVCEQSKMRQKSFRFVRFSSNKDNVWFHMSPVAMLQVSRRCQDYQAVERFPTTLNQPQQHWKYWHEVVWIAKRIELAIKRGKIEGSTMDSITMMRVESKDDSQLRNLSHFA